MRSAVLAESGGIVRTIFKAIGFDNLLRLVDNVRHVNLANR
jgi:hypothetical protein